MTKTADIVTAHTYIELSELDYDQFQQELNIMHGQLQYTASSSTGEDEALPNGIWHKINGPGAYQFMLEKVLGSPEHSNVVLELTNNLEYYDSDMTLPASADPTMTVESSVTDAQGRADIEAREVPVYPAWFTLTAAPSVSFPPPQPQSHTIPAVRSYSPPNARNPKHFEQSFPQGLTLTPLTFLAPPIDVHNSLLLLWTEAVPHFTQARRALEPNSITIYLRPPEQLGRRYSIPFDEKTTSHGAPIQPTQAKRVTSANEAIPSSTTSTYLPQFGEAKYVVPDFGIWGGDGTVV